MSVYTTLTITRSRAKDYIADKLNFANNKIDDKILEHILEIFLEDDLYNCRIVPDDFKEADWK